jgi:hypothetical protein
MCRDTSALHFRANYDDVTVSVDNVGEVVDSLQNLVLCISRQLHLSLVVDRDAYGLRFAAPCLFPFIDKERRELDLEAWARISHFLNGFDKIMAQRRCLVLVMKPEGEHGVMALALPRII